MTRESESLPLVSVVFSQIPPDKLDSGRLFAGGEQIKYIFPLNITGQIPLQPVVIAAGHFKEYITGIRGKRYQLGVSFAEQVFVVRAVYIYRVNPIIERVKHTQAIRRQKYIFNG